MMKTVMYKIGDKVKLTKIGKEVTFFNNPDGIFMITKLETATDFQITNSNEPNFQWANPEDVYKVGGK